ncbi:phosphatase PAP2 family protein [Altererythrobacter sp. MF3-039]|uniref:phosphatase PAP2 family protein n=1 Tax=Altererythrobacter sp. MF3-039 TaxID=3252901 RepID=UPI00390C5222
MDKTVGRLSDVVGAPLRQPSLLWGYIVIALIAIISTFGISVYRSIYRLETSEGSPLYIYVSLVLIVLATIMRPLFLVARLHPEPLRQLRLDLARYKGWIASSVLAMLAIPQTLQFSSTMKQTIPQIMPFYADEAIISLEYAILGVDAWQITHSFLGEWSTRQVDLLYGLWHLVNISLLVWLVVTMNRRFQVQAILTYQLIWILLGGVMATLLSSVGPCFLEELTGDRRFAPLMERLGALNDTEQLHSFTAMGYLLASRGTDAFGSGISAMPSLHVAIAFLTMLVVINQTRLLLIRLTASAYFGIILIGSVHLGWHYLLDGLAAIPLVLFIWWACGRMARWLDRGAVSESLN